MASAARAEGASVLLPDPPKEESATGRGATWLRAVGPVPKLLVTLGVLTALLIGC